MRLRLGVAAGCIAHFIVYKAVLGYRTPRRERLAGGLAGQAGTRTCPVMAGTRQGVTMPRVHPRLGVGHAFIGEAIFVGLEESVRTMRALMYEARAKLGIAAE